MSRTHHDGLITVEVERIDANRWQPRSMFEDRALIELAASIAAVGVLQPLVIRPEIRGRHELIAGERRLRASKMVGLSQVPAIIRSTSDQAALEIALIENIQREEIAPLECARAYRQLMQEFGLTQEQVADRVGKSRSGIANTLRLLKLSPKIQDGLEAGRITEGHARALLAFEHEDQQLAVYNQILAKGLNVREVEALGSRKPSRPRSMRGINLERVALEDAISIHLGARVTIQHGQLSIPFGSEDELAGILERMGME